MTILSGHKLKKEYMPDLLLFEDATFNINAGDRVGLVGVNGSGKSTLFSLITDQAEADQGEIFKAKNLNLAYLTQFALENTNNTVYDELLTIYQDLLDIEEQLKKVNQELEIYSQKPDSQNKLNDLVHLQSELNEQYELNDGYTYKNKARSTLLGLGFTEAELKKNTAKLSGGERTRLELAKILLNKADLILLDEPTNHLDIKATEWLEDFLKNYQNAFIIISHDRYFLDAVTDHTFILENKRLNTYSGNYSAALQKREQAKLSLEKAYYNQQKEIKRIEGIIAQQRQWNREKNIRTAESKAKVVAKIKANMVKPEKDPSSIKFNFNIKTGSGNDVLTVEDLGKSFGDKKVFSNINMHITKGQKVFLLGGNGSGKTTLLKVLLQQKGYTDFEGCFNLGHNIAIGYYDQKQTNLNPDNTILDEIWQEFNTKSETEIRSALAWFLFKNDEVYKKIGVLSGGEKARVSLTKLVLGQANFLLLDEPTNHLDVESREMLERALLNYPGTILAVSHDRYFANKLADEIYYMENGTAKHYLGNYDYYLEKNKALTEQDPNLKRLSKTNSKNNLPISEPVIHVKEQKQKQDQEQDIDQNQGSIDFEKEKILKGKYRKIIKDIANLEKQISAKEDALVELEEKLIEHSQDYEKLIDLNKNRQSLESEIENHYQKWEILNHDKEKLPKYITQL